MDEPTNWAQMYTSKRGFMRFASTLGLLALASFAVLSCSGNAVTGSERPITLTGTVDTVIIDYLNFGGINLRSAYLQFSNNTLTYLPANTWDLSIARQGKKVIANCGNYGVGVRLFKTSQTDISADYSARKDSVKNIVDSLGNPFTHTLDSNGLGSDTVYLIKDIAGQYYKVQFESFDSTGHYLLNLAPGLAGSAQALTGTLDSSERSAYFDLSADSEVAYKLPQSWDLRFARGVEFTEGPLGIGARSAVMLNTDAGIQAGLISGKTFDEVTSAAGVTLSSFIDVIGANWYAYNAAANPPYSVNPGVWIVKTADGTYWKLALLTFYGPKAEEFYTLFQFAQISGI